MAGRPKIELDRDSVAYLLAMNFKASDIADILEVSPKTLSRRLQEWGLSKYTSISDAELEAVVRDIKAKHPNDGEVMMQAHLLSCGIYVKRAQLRQAIHHVDPLNVALRRLKTVQRRQYMVKGPNAIWHIDGHHKLIRWRMVIHGGVDGYSRMIVFLKCSPNNFATTVLQEFEKGVQLYGLPEKVRTDHGGENVEVWRVMEAIHGTSSAVVTGSSTHNERIERMWNDVWRSAVQEFYHLFYEMESCNMLNPLNETDIYCLHYTFLPRISSILDSFASGWNNHKLSTEGNRSPNQLFIQGLLDFDNESQSSTAQPLPNPSVPHATAATSSSISTSPAMHTTQGSSNQSTSNNQDLYAQDCVEVPRSRFSPCQVLHQIMASTIDPLADSTSFGKDIYLMVLQIVANHLRHQPNCGCTEY